MKMERRKLRIGDLAEQVGVKRFVIRFWEKEFGMESPRSDGGQRYYDNYDYQKFSLIKKLLYEDRLTIEGAKKFFREKIKEENELQVQASSKTYLSSTELTKELANTLNLSTENSIANSIALEYNHVDNSNNNNNNNNSYFEKEIEQEKKLSKFYEIHVEKLIELQKKLIKLREIL